MLILAFVVAAVFVMAPADADSSQPSSATPAPQTRYVGETLSYNLHALMSQSIAGKDVFGRPINQTSAPTNVQLHESIAITKTTPQDLSVHRTGTITAVVKGANPVTKSGQGWTTIDNQGMIVRDSGKLGGLFLLPLQFLADASMNDGGELAVGKHWFGRLGTRLYGMTARPHLNFAVIAERRVSGTEIYTIEVMGTAPMKEPVMTAAGEPLGFATGNAAIKAQLEYDRDNRRLISMSAELSDTLHYTGPAKHVAGRVKDRERCDVSLDLSSLAGGVGQQVDADPPAGPQP